MFNWNGGDIRQHTHTHTHTHTHKHTHTYAHTTLNTGSRKSKRVVIPFGSHRQTFVAPLKKQENEKRNLLLTHNEGNSFQPSIGVSSSEIAGQEKKKKEKKRKKREKIPFYDRLYVFLRVFSAF